jgi:cytochrome c oxidase cbb3-type subunit I/II
MYFLRSLGGLLYLSGTLVMAYNLYKTATIGAFQADEAAEAPALEKNPVFSGSNTFWHRAIERKPLLLTGLSAIIILIGGLVEIVPTLLIKSNIPTIASVKPYTPLELHGRDIYIREGCVGCHSQMIRPFRSETERYGEYSKAGEFVYDHPFLWGSKRTGPDLHRIGQKYPDSWHFQHMLDPGSISPGTIMPAYPWLFTQSLDLEQTAPKIRVLTTLGVPYAEDYDGVANEDLINQAKGIVESLRKDNIQSTPELEIVALIAYLQRLGTDINVKDEQAVLIEQSK